MLNDQDLSTYGIVQNLAWGGSVPALAEHLGWDAQAVVSRVREGEGPKEAARVYRVSGQLMMEGAIECDADLLEALGAGLDSVAIAALSMLGEVLRRTVEVRTAPPPEDTTSLHGDWVQTAVRVLVGEESHEIRQYMRPTDVAEVVRVFSAEDEATGEADEGPILDESQLPEAAREPESAPGSQTPPRQASAPKVGGAAETAAAMAPEVPFQVQQWPQVSEQRPAAGPPASLDLLYDVPLTMRAELGRTRRKVEDIIGFGPGSVVDLDRMVGDMVDLYANGQWVARGEVVVVEDNFGVRITEIGSAAERALKLRLREGS
ncbi:MAG: flagellar motor switch protein FliN [Thermaerobacter sp.]|nr:flagellar motor switch protein FliN [Thermaerobacter sp.]